MSAAIAEKSRTAVIDRRYKKIKLTHLERQV